MASIILRVPLGTVPLTNAQVDSNFQNLNNALGANGSTTVPTPSGTGVPLLSVSPTTSGTFTADALKVVTGAAAGKMLVSAADGTLSYLGAGATTDILIGGGAANPVWTAATGTGSPVRSTNASLTSPTLTTPALGTPASGALTNCTFPILNQNTSGSAGSLSATLAVGFGGTGLTAVGTIGNVLTSNGSAWVSSPPLTNDNQYSITGITGTAATITVDFSTVTASTILIALPSLTTSATITFTNLNSKATASTIFSFNVILSHVTALTTVNSVVWRHGAAVLPKWAGNIIPPSTITANAVDVWTFFTYDTGTSLVGSLSMSDIRNI